MSWKKLLAESKFHAHKTSRKELDDLRAVIVRDLEDAAIQELSGDRRFATAYNAALQTAKMSIACTGFRLASTPGHHRLTFEAARLALGTTAARTLDFFEACRRKRNVIDSRRNDSTATREWRLACQEPHKSISTCPRLYFG